MDLNVLAVAHNLGFGLADDGSVILPEHCALGCVALPPSREGGSHWRVHLRDNRWATMSRFVAQTHHRCGGRPPWHIGTCWRGGRRAQHGRHRPRRLLPPIVAVVCLVYWSPVSAGSESLPQGSRA